MDGVIDQLHQDEGERQFLDAMRWYCEHADLTLDALLHHLAARIEHPEDWRHVRLALRVNDPRQRRAEEALVKLADRCITREATRRRWSGVPGKRVDWTSTYLAQAEGRRGEYCNRVVVHEPNRKLKRALAGLALRWARLVQDVPVAQHASARVDALRLAYKRLGGESAPWDLAIARQLQNLSATHCAMILEGLSLWSHRGSRGAALAAQFADWTRSPEARKVRSMNADILFEWTAALWVAEAACDLGWTLDVDERPRVAKKYAPITLRRGDLVLRIAKGVPRDGHGKRLRLRGEADRITRARRATGIRATGLQPDIVLTYHRRATPEHVVTFLADAKRNTTEDGRKYLTESVSKAASYVYAFGECLVAAPRCTLFCWQGVDKVLWLKREAGDGETVVQRLAAAFRGGPVPDIMCLDRGWIHAKALHAWLTHLSDTAEEALMPGGAARRSPETSYDPGVSHGSACARL